MGTFFGGAFRLSPHLIRILCNLDSPFSPLPLPVQLAATALCTVSPPNRQPQRQERRNTAELPFSGASGETTFGSSWSLSTTALHRVALRTKQWNGGTLCHSKPRPSTQASQKRPCPGARAFPAITEGDGFFCVVRTDEQVSSAEAASADGWVLSTP